jgi:hypothetical protein
MVPITAVRRPEYDASCGNRTARMFLETMYGEFFSEQPGVRHLMQVNSEHLFLRDAAMHSRIDTFLCKTHFCQHLMQQHIADAGLQARSIYMAHSSVDFSVGGGGGGRLPGRLPGWLPGWLMPVLCSCSCGTCAC